MLRNDHALTNNGLGALGVAAGVLFGSMIGAATMLLFAPQSGKRTRAQIQMKGIELRDLAAEKLEDTAAQARLESKKLAKSGRHKAKEIYNHGQELAKEQISHVTEIVKNGKHSLLRS